MSITLKALNTSLTKNQHYSYLNTNYSSGVTAIVVTNSANFTANDYLLLGEFGMEQSEIVQIDTVTASSHTLALKAATKFAHSESTKVTVLSYNRAKFYHTTTTTYSTSEQIGSTVDIQPDSLYTLVSDATNTTGYGWYVWYNSTTDKSTVNSNYIPYADFAANTAKKIIDGFLRSLNQRESMLISMTDAFEWLTEGYSIALTELNMVNKEYSATISSTITTVSGTAEYDFPTNASEIIAVWDDTYDNPVDECPLNKVDKRNNDDSTTIQYYIRGNKIGFAPTPDEVISYKLTYITKPATMTSLTDTIDLPDNKHYILKDYLRFRAAEPLGKKNGPMYFDLFMKGVLSMKTSAIKRSGKPDSWDIEDESNV